MNRVPVIIRTCNELDNICPIIRQLHDVLPDAAVLVVDERHTMPNTSLTWRRPLRRPTLPWARADALGSIHPETMRSQGYFFQIEMLWKAAAMELRIVEVPVTLAERICGSSTMSNRVIAEAMLRVTGWGVRTLLTRPSRTRELIQPLAHV